MTQHSRNNPDEPVGNDAYAEGLEAAHSGKCAADCPYEYNAPEGEKWMQGYQDGGGVE